MSWSRLAEQKLRAAVLRGELSNLAGSGRPLPPDALEGLSGDELQEALVHRAIGIAPPEVEAMRRVEALRRERDATAPGPAQDLLATELRKAEVEAAMLLERSGRLLTASRY